MSATLVDSPGPGGAQQRPHPAGAPARARGAASARHRLSREAARPVARGHVGRARGAGRVDRARLARPWRRARRSGRDPRRQPPGVVRHGSRRPRLGAASVGVFVTAPADEVSSLLQRAKVRVAIAEDAEQLDKLLEVHGQTPLERIVVIDTRGISKLDLPAMSFEALEASGNPDAVTVALRRRRRVAPAGGGAHGRRHRHHRLHSRYDRRPQGRAALARRRARRSGRRRRSDRPRTR